MVEEAVDVVACVGGLQEAGQDPLCLGACRSIQELFDGFSEAGEVRARSRLVPN